MLALSSSGHTLLLSCSPSTTKRSRIIQVFPESEFAFRLSLRSCHMTDHVFLKRVPVFPPHSTLHRSTHFLVAPRKTLFAHNQLESLPLNVLVIHKKIDGPQSRPRLHTVLQSQPTYLPQGRLSLLSMYLPRQPLHQEIDTIRGCQH